MRRTTKAAALTDDSVVPNRVAFRVCYTKPVHFLSKLALFSGLKWTDKRKKLFVSRGCTATWGTDMYNNRMNDVHIVDQLRGTYQLGQWMRKHMQCWSIWVWGL